VSELGEEVMNGILKISTVISLSRISEARSKNDDIWMNWDSCCVVLRCSDGDSDEIDINNGIESRKRQLRSHPCNAVKMDGSVWNLWKNKGRWRCTSTQL